MNPAPDTEPATVYGTLALSQEQFNRFRVLIRDRTGIALGPEKSQLVCTRLSRRVKALGMDSFDAYHDLVASGDPREAQQFANAVTTNLTRFFREPSHFTVLRDRVVGTAVRAARRGGPRKIRVWCTAASTGEEPYSIAMTVLDALPDRALWDIRVLATDLDTAVLAHGERGVYPDNGLDDVPVAYHPWFIRGTGPQEGKVRARRELREAIAFRPLNLMDDPWPVRTTFDAVFCRNVLIYFDGPTQAATVTRLSRHLAPGATLFLGHAESLLGMRAGLTPTGDGTFVRRQDQGNDPDGETLTRPGCP